MKTRYWFALGLPVVGIVVWLARHWRAAGYRGWNTVEAR
jgi:hypothetical protein